MAGVMGSVRWQVDTSHASVEFSVKHMGIMTVRGSFSEIDGTVETEEGRPTAASAVIGIASLSTRDERRDTHLRSADFFDADNHPKMEFRSTAVESRGTNRYQVRGDLTIRGTTHPVTLDMEVSGPVKDPWGNEKMAFTLDGTINRKVWGLEWNVLLEGGGVLVGEDVRIHVEAEAAPAASAA